MRDRALIPGLTFAQLVGMPKIYSISMWSLFCAVFLLFALAPVSTPAAETRTRCADKILSDSAWFGEIVEKRSDGTALIRTNYSPEPYSIPLSRLSKSTEQHQQFREGDSILSDGHYYGHIVCLFDNGMAWIQTNHAKEPYAHPTASLSKEVPCSTATGICKNNTIVSSGYWKGKVLAVYGSERALIQTNYQEKPYTFPVNQLAKVECEGVKACLEAASPRTASSDPMKISGSITKSAPNSGLANGGAASDTAAQAK